MIISNIVCFSRSNKITLQADITFSHQKTEQMYFTVDAQYKNFLVYDASPFLAAVLLPCMKRNENIFIEGSISKKLLRGIKRIMNVYHSWNMGLHPISIRAIRYTTDKQKPKYIASFFSGGVDSFYTYLKHKKKKTNRISHFILVHGFDISLANVNFFRVVVKRIQKIAQKEQVQLIIVKTNAGEIIESRIIWDWGHGGALGSVALCLRNQIKRVYISAAVSTQQLFPYGTHPDIDKHWSTEKLRFVHDGTEYTRLEKVIKYIAKSPLALKNLRVCCQNRNGKYNCSNCFKCLRTMIELTCANALEKCETFNNSIDIEKVAKLYYDPLGNYDITANMLLTFLRKRNKNIPLQNALEIGLQNSKKFSLKRFLSTSIAVFDQKYNDRRIYRFVFSMNTKQDRNIYFKLLTKVGVMK